MQGLKVKKLAENAFLPCRATPGSAGLDLYACLSSPVTIAPGERELIPTGIAIDLPDSTVVGLVYARSGLAIKKGITLSNCVGVIDSDYKGELKIGVINTSKQSYTIEHGDRIAQLVITPILCPDPLWIEELEVSDRGEGGFGSTGRK